MRKKGRKRMSYYALSDLHGNYKIWNKVKDFLKEDDTLFKIGSVFI